MSRGITKIEVNGRELTFDFGLSGWRRIQQTTGKKMGEVIQLLKEADAELLCQVVQGALLRFQPDITLDDAGDIATSMGDELNKAIAEGLVSDDEEVKHPTQSLRAAS